MLARKSRIFILVVAVLLIAVVAYFLISNHNQQVRYDTARLVMRIEEACLSVK